MKQIPYILLLFFLSVSNTLFGTILEESLTDIDPVINSSIDYSGPYTVRLYLHIVRYDNGTGGQTAQDIDDGLTYLYEDFSPHNIFFTVGGMDTINDTDLCDWPSFDNNTGSYDLFSVNKHTNGIDVYLLPEDCGFNHGVAEDIVCTALLVSGRSIINGDTTNHVASHVISHEIGHCLGLYHTFHGTNPDENGCAELVDGSNGETCGDHVADTPADPVNLRDQSNFSTSTCIWNNTSMVDENGDLYDPDESNIMAYVPAHCMEALTDGQGLRMREFLATSSILQPVVLTNELLLKDISIGQGTYVFEAAQTIYMGDTTSTFESGDDLTAIVVDYANVELRSHGKIVLNPGTGIDPLFGSFVARIIDDIPEGVSSPSSAPKSKYSQSNNPEIDLNSVEVNKCLLFPNPTDGKFRIYLNHPTARIQTVSLYDADGRLVTTIGVNLNLIFLDMDISSLRKGLYFCHIKTNNENGLFKIIKK